MPAEAFGNLRFYLEIDGITEGIFQQVNGLTSETEVIEHRHAGKKGNIIVRKVPGALKWSNITFKRGVTDDTKLHEWRKAIEDGKIASSRKNGTITCYAPDLSVVAQYNFINAWPCKLSGPSMDATQNQLAIEELELCHEGLTRAK
jgi:phage tail-like protein